jgi:hypothetical protein
MDQGWYNQKAMDTKFDGYRTLVDMLIVDGPPAYARGYAKARLPALPYFFDKLSPSCSVFLDDADRKGEKEVIKSWKREFGMSFSPVGCNLARAVRGHAWNIL